MTTTVDEAFALQMGEGSARFPTPLDRLLYMRTLPNLGGLVRGAELTQLANSARERFFPAGSHVYQPNEVADSVHFLVEGRVSLVREGLRYLTVEPPWASGFLSVLANAHEEGVADVDTLALEVSAADVREILEDNFSFLHTGLSQLVRQVADVQRELELMGVLRRSEPETVPYPEQPLDLVQRLSVLRRGAYESVNLEALLQLARQSEEVRMDAGEVVWRDGDEASWGLHIVHGVLRCVGDDGKREFVFGPGSLVGYLEAYGARPRRYTATVEDRLVAMKGTAQNFYNVVEDNYALGIGFMSAIAGALRNLYFQRAKAKANP